MEVSIEVLCLFLVILHPCVSSVYVIEISGKVKITIITNMLEIHELLIVPSLFSTFLYAPP